MLPRLGPLAIAELIRETPSRHATRGARGVGDALLGSKDTRWRQVTEVPLRRGLAVQGRPEHFDFGLGEHVVYEAQAELREVPFGLFEVPCRGREIKASGGSSTGDGR